LGRTFRLLQVAVGTSDLGDGIFRILVPLVGLTIDRSPVAVTLVSLSMRLPGPLVTIPAGYLLDRSRRRAFISLGSALIRLVSMAAICALVAAGMTGIWSLCLVSFVAIAASNVNDLAVQASLPVYVERKRLAEANSWVYTAQVLLVQMVGPAAAGVLLGRASAPAALALVGVLFLLAAAVFSTLIGARTPPRTGPPPAGGFFYGFTYIFRDRVMLQLSMLAALNNLCYAMVFTFLPAWIVSPGPVHGTATQYGWAASTMAVGSLLGGALGSRLRPVLTDHRVMKYGFVVIAGSFALVLTARLPLIMAGLACYGAVSMIWNVRVVSFRQSTIPPEVFGRVNGAFRWFTLGSPALGAALAGVIADSFGMPAVFLTAVTLCCGAALVFLVRPLAFPGDRSNRGPLAQGAS
jgi:MFS family permease